MRNPLNSIIAQNYKIQEQIQKLQGLMSGGLPLRKLKVQVELVIQEMNVSLEI